MDAQQTITSAGDYETLSVAALTGAADLLPDEARAVAASRWPLEADAVLVMLRNRGLELTEDDLTAYLLFKYSPITAHPDGEPLTARSVTWPERNVEGALVWALENGVGTPVPPQSPDPRRRPVWTVADMLQGLRSSDLVERVCAGAYLSRSLGAGCAVAGETSEDFDLILRPQLVALLTRAVQGESAAVDELEAAVTTTHPQERAARRRRSAKN